MSTAMVLRRDVPPCLESAVESSRRWLVAVARELQGTAFKHQDKADALVDKVITIVACASLPGDMPVRVRCTPNVFYFTA